MKIGIIGSGKRRRERRTAFRARGHQAAVSNSRGRGTLKELVAELDDNARALTEGKRKRKAFTVISAISAR
jgi:hypothetical protein